jgi:hypothetical protein
MGLRNAASPYHVTLYNYFKKIWVQKRWWFWAARGRAILLPTSPGGNRMQTYTAATG